MNTTDRLLVWVVGVLSIAALLVAVFYHPTVPAGQQQAGYTEGTHYGQITATNVESTGSMLADAGLTVAGGINSTGGASFTGTSTLGFTPNQPYIVTTPFGTSTSTVVSFQYSGPTVAVDSDFLDFDPGSAAITSNGSYRAYISKGRVDANTNATGTLFSKSVINSSTVSVAYGGPVPSSYYVSSTAFINGLNGVTTTPIMLFNGDWVNVTSSILSTSTGRLILISHPF